MPRLATERVTRGLRWTGTGLLVAGAVVVVGGIGLTHTVDALVTASSIAVLGFGLPGAAAFSLALWLEHVADKLEPERVRPAPAEPTTTPARNPFREPVRGYAVALAAVLVAWGVRAALDVYIPNEVPFITFYLAVAVAGWAGGFGPAAFATLLSLVVAGVFYVMPDLRPNASDLGRFVVLGLFMLVCLGISAIMATLREALARTQQLAEATRRRRQQARDHPLRALAQSAPVALFAADPMLACTYCNTAWLSMRGRTLTQELGNGWWDGVHPEDLGRRREAFEQALAERRTIVVEYRLRHADGEFRSVRDMITAPVDAQGDAIGLVGACLPFHIQTSPSGDAPTSS
jgi:PAS domain S-box-containing protein